MTLKDKNQKFPLIHVTLYAKGWYDKSENIVEDLIKILRLDGYTPFLKNDVCRILLYRYEDTFNVSLSDFIDAIQESESWRVGYWTELNGGDKKYDYQTAIIFKILSDLRWMESSQVSLKFPQYSKENPRPKTITLDKLKEVFLKNKTLAH